MTHFTPLRSAVTVVALLCASTATADVTAAEVWADWQESLSIYGDEGIKIGAETMDGDTLTVSGIKLESKDDYTEVTAEVGDLMFTELGDGTVAVTVDPTFPITITSETNDVVKLKVTQSGLKMIVSGTADEMNYEFSADQYALVVDEITQDGKPIKADIRMTLNDVSGSQVSKMGEMRNMVYELSAASLDMLADITPPETSGDYITFSGRIEDLSTTGDITMPLAVQMDEPSDMFTKGFAMAAGYDYTSANYIFDIKSEGEQTSGTSSTGAGMLDVKMSEDAMTYDSSLADFALALKGASLPFPIEVSMAEYGFGIDMPMSKTEEPADFGLRLNLTDLAVNDMIWAMADPAGALPHDPATILLDLSGKAQLFFNLFDPDQAEAMAMADVPGELNALTLNNLQVKAAGVDVMGTGDFTFDNTDKVTFDGMPRPTGDVTVNIAGANALIDSLVKMGFVPEEQAMMGRMMMGMFAQTTGDDALTSKIEINEQGHVIANGQRIQ